MREPPTVNDTLRSARHAPLSSRPRGARADREMPMTQPTQSPIEPAAAVAPELTFADFDVHPDIVASLADAGIIIPFPIQAMTLPVALGGHDIIGQAKTGTGKTLGFGVPILNRVVTPADEGYAALARPGKPQALAVAPTRELAVQVAGDLERAGRRRGVRVLTVYGGRAYEPQIEALRTGVEVVVGTPGRLIDLAKQGHLDLSQARTVVLDEADEMLDLGFLPDVETLMSLTPASRQTMLFSATMPGAIVALARRYMSQPTHIRAMGDDTENAHTVKAVEQFVYRAHAMDKVEMLSRMLQATDRGLTIIFSRTKRTAAKVVRRARRARLRGRRDPRRPRSGGPRAGAPGLPQRQGRHPRRHRRRRPRHRRRQRHARHQLPVPRGREDLPAPHRPHRARRQHRCRRHLRRLGRPAPVGPHQQGARPRHPRPAGDLLELRPPLQRPRHPDRRQGSPAPLAADPGRPRGRGDRGPRRDRQAPRQVRRARRGRDGSRDGGRGGSRSGGRGDGRGRDGGSRDGSRDAAARDTTSGDRVRRRHRLHGADGCCRRAGSTDDGESRPRRNRNRRRTRGSGAAAAGAEAGGTDGSAGEAPSRNGSAPSAPVRRDQRGRRRCLRVRRRPSSSSSPSRRLRPRRERARPRSRFRGGVS